MDFNGDLNLATLQPASSFPELCYPLWWYSGSSISVTDNGTTYYIQKGTTSLATASNTSTTLFTAPSFPASFKFALELSIGCSNIANTTSVKLYDFTSGTAISNSLITANSATMTVTRSGQFTLTSGHNYGIQITSTNSGYTSTITDASLIVFPSSPLTSPSVSAISLANPSGNALKEAYIPLWVYSSGSAYTTATTTGVNNSNFLSKGGTTSGGAGATSVQLYNLSTSWKSSQKFALEASIYTSGSTYTTYAQLYDCTSDVLAGYSISTTATTATVVRSSAFTLTPGHKYGVTFWTSGQTAYITKAHLVALA